jgi:hypothetical protein
MFAALENLNDSEDINRAWENIKEYIRTSATETLGLYELKQHKPSFDEECLCSLEKRKQAKMQLLQDPNQNNVDNLNNVKRGTSRHFGKTKTEYPKTKIDELETNSKIENVRDLYTDISDFKKGYQARTNIVTEKGDLFTDFHRILARWRYHFSQLFNVHGVMKLSRQKYTQQSHQCLSRVPLR